MKKTLLAFMLIGLGFCMSCESEKKAQDQKKALGKEQAVDSVQNQKKEINIDQDQLFELTKKIEVSLNDPDEIEQALLFAGHMIDLFKNEEYSEFESDSLKTLASINYLAGHAPMVRAFEERQQNSATKLARYAYVDTVLAYNVLQACNGMESAQSCLNMTRIIEERRQQFPKMLWDDPPLGRHSEWPENSGLYQYSDDMVSNYSTVQ